MTQTPPKPTPANEDESLSHAFGRYVEANYPGLSVERALSALASAHKLTLDEQARNQKLINRAKERGIDPAYKDLYDVQLPGGYLIQPKTLPDGETICRLVPPEGGTLFTNVEAMKHAQAWGFPMYERAFGDGMRMVVDLKDYTAAVMNLPYALRNHASRIATVPDTLPTAKPDTATTLTS